MELKKVRQSISYTNSCLVNSFLTVMDCVNRISSKTTCHVDNLCITTKLVLRNQYHSKAEKVVLSVNASTMLNRLRCLSGISIDNKAINNLAIGLNKHLAALRKLTINHCDLKSTALVTLFSSCRDPPTGAFQSLTNLDLCHNNITDDAVIVLIQSILVMPNLQIFIADNNKIKEYNMNEIFTIIKSKLKPAKSLHSLDYDSVQSVIAFLSLLQILLSTGHLEKLEIFVHLTRLKLCVPYHTNRCTLKADASTFFQICTCLIELKFHGISFTLQAMDTVSKALAEDLASLQELTISNCKFDGTSAVSILPYNNPSLPVAFKNLIKLDMSNNSITDEEIEPLVASLLQMVDLRQLLMGHTKFINYDPCIIFDMMKIQTYSVNYERTNDVAAFLLS